MTLKSKLAIGVSALALVVALPKEPARLPKVGKAGLERVIQCVDRGLPIAFFPFVGGFSTPAQGGYQIARSLRFNSADSARLSRTFGTPTDSNVWTISLWIKRTEIGADSPQLFATSNGAFGYGGASGAGATDTMTVFDAGYSILRVGTSYIHRDPTAFQHVVLRVDTDQATASNRLRLYINNTQISFDAQTSFPAQGADIGTINTAVTHYIGANNGGFYFGGMIAEVHFIDGQSLAPSAFAATDFNGQWSPTGYSGSYGNNGFWLSFANNASATTLGYDDAGGAAGAGAGSNDWTLTNFSVTAGAGNDSLTDTPTNYGTDTGAGGEVRGNYPTQNPLNGSANYMLNGNLDFSMGPASLWTNYMTTPIPRTGKWYFELTYTSGRLAVGMSLAGAINQALMPDQINDGGWNYIIDLGFLRNYNAASLATYTALSAGHVLMCAYDADSGKLWIGSQGTWFNSGAPASGTGQVKTQTTGVDWVVGIGNYGSASTVGSLNFGQRPFAYTAPSGFKALCTQNLTSTTVALPSTFTGNANADGPYVWANGIVNSVTINGNVASEGTHFRKVAGGIKIITSSSSYNQSGSNTVSAATYGTAFKYARAA
jgi:hypothetical protein